MTSRLVYEAVCIELNKMQAPTLKIFAFNHLCNKAITQYVNKVYNVYGINQQATDDLRVLETTACLKPTISKNSTYVVDIPMDYLHLLNCVCVFEIKENKGCWKKGEYVEVPATRLTSDSWNQISTDVYNKPSPTNPYFFLHNVNTNPNIPTNPETDITELYSYKGDEGVSNFKRTFILPNKTQISLVNKPTAFRIGNPSTIRCEIRCGKNNKYSELSEVHIDYLKVPQLIQLTLEQVDLIEDTSQIMEFPEYVNYEIINELVHLAMENVNDPRLGNHILMTLTIARPTGQLSQ